MYYFKLLKSVVLYLKIIFKVLTYLEESQQLCPYIVVSNFKAQGCILFTHIVSHATFRPGQGFWVYGI